MTIGKREQIVVGVIVAIILVAVLHMTLFGQQQRELQTARSDYDQALQSRSLLKRAPNPKVLSEFTSTTQLFLSSLERGFNQIGLEEPAIFKDMPKPEDPNFLQTLIKRLNEQVDAIMQETAKLATLRGSRNTRMTFLDAQNWALPSELPPAMQQATLWDTLNDIKDARGVLNNSPSGTDIYNRTKALYDQKLLQLGLDLKQVARLNQFGDFVPTYYQYQFLHLILARMPADRPIQIRGETLTRAMLMDLLGIEFPNENFPDLNLYKTYFLYQYLVYLNQALRMAESHGIAEVSNVTLWGHSFLRKALSSKQVPGDLSIKPISQLIDDRTACFNFSSAVEAAMLAQLRGQGSMGFLPLLTPSQKAMLLEKGNSLDDIRWMTAEDLNGYGIQLEGVSAEGVMWGADGVATPTPTPLPNLITKPTEDDVGLAFPVEITFRAPNKEGFAYIYDLMNLNPLNEIYRMEMTSMSTQRPDDPNVEFKVAIVFVSKLFKTMDTVRQLLDEIANKPGQPVAPANPTAAAAMTAPPANATPTPAPTAPPVL